MKLRNWQKWQASIIANVMRSRRARIKEGRAPRESEHAPLSIQSVAVASVFDEDFAAFAALVGPATAETFWLRVCQYVANGHALDGNCPVSRTRFGVVVLSRPWHLVTQAKGAQVYDALIQSRLCVDSCDATCSATSDATSDATGNGTCSALTRAGHARSEPCPAVPSRSESPPYPPPAEGGSAAPLNGNGQEQHVRPREARKIAEAERLAKAASPEHLAEIAKRLPEGVAMHGGYVRGEQAAQGLPDPAAKAREAREAMLNRPPPAVPMRGPDVEPVAPPRVADQGKLERLKAEALAKIAEMERGDEACPL